MGEKPQGELWRWQHSTAEAAPVPLEPVQFEAIDGWNADGHCDAIQCYLQLAGQTLKPLPAPGEVSSLLEDREKARAFFEKNFAAFRILGTPGLLTAYFDPVLKGSRQQSAAFPVPVYRRPDDLTPLPRGHPLSDLGQTAGRKTASGFERYFTRGEIEAGAVAGRGLEILYLADPIEAFIMHVQGSGLVQLDDGTAVRLSFDGKNGHAYTSVSKVLIDRGELLREDAHLDGTVAWLSAQRERLALLNENKSYIFFREMEHSATAPKGSSGACLHAGRSLAADPLYHGAGTPIWVAAPELDFEAAPFRRLLIAQDTGSAITGPQRGDVFAGTGADAGRVAGRIRHSCEFIALRPKR